MEILGQFGFEPVLFAAQVVNFLILAALFKKFLYKPILKVLKEREKKIARGIEDAHEALKDRENAEAEKESILKRASAEAEKILQETQKNASELKEKILNETKSDAEKILTEAKKQADTQMEAMERRAKKASLDNSMAILEKILSEMFTKNEKEKILERSMKNIKNYD